MRKLAIAALMIFWFANNGVAHAVAPADEIIPADILQLARSTWPDSPCNGKETIALSPAGTLTNAMLPGERVPAMAVINTPDKFVGCNVDLDESYLLPEKRGYLCSIIAHEFGHLAGYDHDYGGVMGYDTTYQWEPCASFYPPPVASAAPVPPLSATAPAVMNVDEAKHLIGGRGHRKCRQPNPNMLTCKVFYGKKRVDYWTVFYNPATGEYNGSMKPGKA
jgi:hypothetical protein